MTPAVLSTAPVAPWVGPVFVTDSEIDVARHVLREVAGIIPRIAPGAFRADPLAWLRPLAGPGALSPAAAGVYVNLANVHLTDAQLAHILQLLLPLRCLRSVDVSGNIITDLGANTITALLRTAGGGEYAGCGTLYRVDVSGNQLTMGGLVMLADAVRRAPSVVRLLAYNQYVSGSSIEDVREATAVTHSIQNLLSARTAAARMYANELQL